MSNHITALLKKNFTFKTLLLVIVGLAVFFAVFNYIGFGKTVKALYLVNPLILCIFAFSRLAIYLLASYKWKFFTDAVEKISFAQLLPIYFSGMIIDNIIPGPGFGGEPVKAYYLHKLTKKSISQWLATALMDSIVFSIALLGFLVFSFAYVFLYIQIPIIRSLITAILVILFAFLLLLAYFYSRKKDHAFADRLLGIVYRLKFLRKRFAKFEHFKEHLAKHFAEFILMMKKLFSTKDAFLVSLFISFWIIIIDILGMQLLLKGFGLEIPFLQVLVVVIVSSFIGFYSPTPGGTGFAEGSMILLWNFIGVGVGIAGAVTLISRLSFYIITYGFGYLALVYVNLKYVR